MEKSAAKKALLIMTVLLLTLSLGVILFGCNDFGALDEINGGEDGKISSSQNPSSGKTTYNSYTVTTEVGTPSEVYTEYSDMVADVVNTVVVVYVKTSSDSDWVSNGAGVFYGGAADSEGNKATLIITCCHVIDSATEVLVAINTGDTDPSNDRQEVAEVVGMDDVSDVAVLKIDGEYDIAKLRNTDEAPIALGEKATAIGNPLGAGISVTQGIISGTSKSVSMDGITMTLLQTDAAVNGGNSGGALFDAQGYLIGMVNAKSSGENIEGMGYAIPVYDVMYNANSLISTSGNPEYSGLGYIDGEIRLGATFALLNAAQVSANFPSIPSTPGEGEYYYYVNSSASEISAYGSIAKSGQAGAMAGNIIKSVTVNGETKTFNESFQLEDLLNSVRIGDTVTFNLIVRERHSAGIFQTYYTYSESTSNVTMYQYVYGGAIAS